MAQPENRSLIPLGADTKNALVSIPTQELTSQQSKQLEQAVRQYLRAHKLTHSYENVQKSRGAIRSCIEDGLETTKGDTKVQPFDNLFALFEIGFKNRLSTITATQQLLKTLPGSGTYQGSLALPESLVAPCQSVLAKATFTANLDSCRQLTELTAVRRPIFRKLLAFTRQQVEEIIPGSKTMELKPEQEAGLVRNLIFAWVVFQKPLPLLETEDFMLNSSEYKRELDKKDKNIWQELATSAGIDSADANLFLEQLGQQVGELTATIPRGATPDPQKIDLAFRQLNPNFLVVNPFLKLTEISENPKDPESIWDRNHAQTLEIGGALYRVPLPSTLVLTSYRQDPRRKHQLQQAAILTNQLAQEVKEQETDPQIPALQNRIDQQRKAIGKLPEQIRDEADSSDIMMSKPELGAYARTQREIIRNELELFPYIRSLIAEQLETAYQLLPKYLDGSCVADSRELPVFTDLYQTPSYVSRILLRFLRERLMGRLRNFQYLYGSANLEDFLATRNHTRLDRYYPKALQTTVIDVLKLRSAFYIDDFKTLMPELSDWSGGRVQLLGGAVAQEMHGQIISGLLERAHVPRHRARSYVAENMESLLRGDEDPVRRLYNGWRELAERLKRGHLDSSAIPQAFYAQLIHRWKEGRLRNAKYALAGWHNQYNYLKDQDEPIEDKHIISSYIKEKLPYLLANQPYEPALLLLRTIVRLSQGTQRLDQLPDLAGLTRFPALEHKAGEIDNSDRSDVTESLKNLLAARNIPLDEDVISNALSPYIIGTALNNTRTLAIFYRLEPEIKTWLRNILVKTNGQLKQEQRILRSDPTKILSTAQKKLSASQSRLERLEKEKQHALSSRIRQLEHLGVILPEETFTK